MIMTNYSSIFSNSHDSGSATTEMPYHQYNGHNGHNGHNNRWYGDVLDTLAEICRRQPKARLQTCIRNELIKRCRYSMLQDRITSSPGRWNQRQGDSSYGGDYYGGDQTDSRRRFHQTYSGNNRPDYGDPSSQYYPRGNQNEDTDEEDFGYSDGDSMGYK